MRQAGKTRKTESSAWISLGANEDTVLMQGSEAGNTGTLGTEVMQALQPSGGLSFHSRYERGLLSRGGILLWVQSYGLWLEMELRGLMENLGYSWRYSNMSQVVMKEARSSDFLVTILWRHIGLFCRAMAACKGQVRLPEWVISSPEAQEMRAYAKKNYKACSRKWSRQ